MQPNLPLGFRRVLEMQRTDEPQMYIDNALRLGNIKLDKQMLPIGLRLQVRLTIQSLSLGIKSPLRRGDYGAGVREFTIEMLCETMNDVAFRHRCVV